MTERDPLLAIARIVITLVMALTMVTGAAFGGSLAAVLVAPEPMLRWLSGLWGNPIPGEAARPIAAIFGLLTAMTILSFTAQRLLRRLIDSVALGDPFVPENARRLASMAWLTLALQALAITVAAFTGWVEYLTGPFGRQFGFSLGGVLLALVLFILARVFRRGAAMREELEGTV
jgi:Protein of unknown function (DUF2975)